MSAVAVALELAYHATDSPGAPTARVLIVFADSITAGVGHETTWPQLLDRELPIGVVDLSRPGETCASALPGAQGLDVPDRRHTIVLLEIGGNDMLGWTSVRQFRQDLSIAFSPPSVAPTRRAT